jgi:hypothetical protein
MMMNAKKHSGKRKSYILSDRPRINADRDALKYAKTPSVYGYIKLPIGRPTKTIDSQTIGPSPSTADTDTALAPATAAAASRASSVKVGVLVTTLVRMSEFPPPWDPIVHDVTRLRLNQLFMGPAIFVSVC